MDDWIAKNSDNINDSIITLANNLNDHVTISSGENLKVDSWIIDLFNNVHISENFSLYYTAIDCTVTESVKNEDIDESLCSSCGLSDCSSRLN